MDPRFPKKPKKEEPVDVEADDSAIQEQEEEALTALIEHRIKEIQHIKLKLSHYKSQLDEAERRLSDSKAKLGRLRSNSRATPAVDSGVKIDIKSSSPAQTTGTPHQLASSRPQLIIPPLNPKVPSPAVKQEPVSSRAFSVASSSQSTVNERSKQESLSRNDRGPARIPEKRAKRKFVQKEHQDLVTSVRSCSSPNLLRFQTGTVLSSQHKRKMRSLELCPVNDLLFVTSALDGIVNLWQVQVKGPSASLLSTTDCVSPKQRKWPEDLAWHPDGDSIFAAYSADGGDSQISILNLNVSGEKKVTFLEGKPHHKGIINSINFMPWVDTCFVTGGSDHAVVLWQEREDSWKHKMVHGNLHSSAVMGISGLQQRKTILSAGADKRIIGFDLSTGRIEFKHQIECKCMSVLPNPSDFNLFMVQTGAPSKQLRLFDIRLRQTEIHAFGWKQESSESQSALINQSWSPDGLYVSSGSADPRIHIFDIRYNSSTPSQSVQAHQKRVFKAIWHQSIPFLTSISSDLNIGLHKVA